MKLIIVWNISNLFCVANLFINSEGRCMWFPGGRAENILQSLELILNTLININSVIRIYWIRIISDICIENAKRLECKKLGKLHFDEIRLYFSQVCYNTHNGFCFRRKPRWTQKQGKDVHRRTKRPKEWYKM